MLVTQAEDRGHVPGVAALDRVPEPRVRRIGDGVVRGDLWPERLMLERVRRQVHPAGSAKQGRPVDAYAVHLQFGQRGHEGGALVAVTAQQGKEQRLRLGGKGVQGHRGQHAVRADLQERGHARPMQLPHAVAEPDRLPHVPHPVGR
ncbi:hypothetical protein GCM10009556_038220 [Acrocarpospora pleiomorpha]